MHKLIYRVKCPIRQLVYHDHFGLFYKIDKLFEIFEVVIVFGETTNTLISQTFAISSDRIVINPSRISVYSDRQYESVEKYTSDYKYMSS